MRILNVLEIVSGNVTIESFVIQGSDGNEEAYNENAVIDAAEELFILKAMENGAAGGEIDDMLEAKEFGGGDYSCLLVWSSVNEG